MSTEQTGTQVAEPEADPTTEQAATDGFGEALAQVLRMMYGQTGARMDRLENLVRGIGDMVADDSARIAAIEAQLKSGGAREAWRRSTDPAPEDG